jgi:hypothetical protein
VICQGLVVFDNMKTLLLQTVAELGMVVLDNKRTSYRRVSYQSLVVFDHKKKTMVLQTAAELGMVVFDNKRLLPDGDISGYGRL